MTYKARYLAILVVAAACAAGTGLGQASAQGTKQIHGLPGKLQRLQDLELIQRTGSLTPLQNTEVLLTWLVEERRVPTQTTKGANGGPVDSNYIQAQIVQMLIGGHGDAKAALWLARSPGLGAVGIKRALYLTKGYFIENPAVLDSLLDTIANDPNPHFRQIAVVWLGLGYSDDPRVDDALKRALLDSYVVRFHSSHSTRTLPGTDIREWRPVREAEEEAIRNRRSGVGKSPEDRNLREQGLRDIERGLAEFARVNRPALDRLLRIANSDRPAKPVK